MRRPRGLLLATDDVPEVRIKDVGTEYQYDVVDVLFDADECMGEALLLALLGMREGTLERVAVVVNDLLFQVA